MAYNKIVKHEVQMQISKRVHALRIPFEAASPEGFVIERFVNVYLIYGSEVCLIDTGVSCAAEMIFDYLRKTERKISDIGLIVQTHAHPDHIGATRTIKAETGCAVAVHATEKPWVENVNLLAEERPLPGFNSLVSGSVAVNRVLEDDDIIDLGCGLKLQVLHTPGHSKGSLSFLLPGFMELFSGDSIPVPGALPVYEDVPAAVKSIKRLRAISGINHLLSAWDDPQKGAEAYQRMDEGLRYIQKVHDEVLRFSGNDSEPDLKGLSMKVLEALGIPPVLSTPIIERSMSAHLELRDKKIII